MLRDHIKEESRESCNEMGMVGVEKTRMAPSLLVSVSGTNDRTRKLWRRGQDEKSDFRNRKLQHSVLLLPKWPIKLKSTGKCTCNYLLK